MTVSEHVAKRHKLMDAIHAAEAQHGDSLMNAGPDDMHEIWKITGGGKKKTLVSEFEYLEIS